MYTVTERRRLPTMNSVTTYLLNEPPRKVQKGRRKYTTRSEKKNPIIKEMERKGKELVNKVSRRKAVLILMRLNYL